MTMYFGEEIIRWNKTIQRKARVDLVLQGSKLNGLLSFGAFMSGSSQSFYVENYQKI